LRLKAAPQNGQRAAPRKAGVLQRGQTMAGSFLNIRYGKTRVHILSRLSQVGQAKAGTARGFAEKATRGGGFDDPFERPMEEHLDACAPG